MTSRWLVALSVTLVPTGNAAEPVLPTATLMPAGLEVTRSPPRPVAVTVSVAFWPGGVTVSVAVRVTLPALAVIVTGVDAVTALVVTVKSALVAPWATEKLAQYRAIVDDFFEIERYEEFCAEALPNLDELMLEYVESDDFDRLLVSTVQTTFPAHEHEHFVAHYRGLLDAWAKDQRVTA